MPCKRNSVRDLVNRIYCSQVKSSKKRGHPPPNYGVADLYSWIISQDNFEHIYSKWVSSNFDKELIPSCDRLDDYTSYRLDNLRLVTWLENRKKSYLDRLEGINRKNMKPIVEFDIFGNEIGRYYSSKQLERFYGSDSSNFTACCKGNILTLFNKVYLYEDNFSIVSLLERLNLINNKSLKKSLWAYSIDENNLEYHSSLADFCSKYKLDSGGVSKALSGDIKSINSFLLFKEKPTDSLLKKAFEDNLKKGSRKGVLKLSKDGIILDKYYSISDASRDNNISRVGISNALLGKSKSSGNYFWRYYEK